MEYQSTTKQCQNCHQSFVIEPDDFSFYEKIKVPPPTFCPECSKQRRLSYRNTHSLYKRNDSFSGTKIISIFSPDKNLVVIDQNIWWGDSWDPFDYGIDYDFSRSFFEQWKDFRDKFPQLSMSNSRATNSDYCNVAEESKDSYLSTACWKIENTLYSDALTEIKDSMDLHVVHKTSFSYEDVDCSDSNLLFYSKDSHVCVDSYFLYDCHGCNNCFMSSNLRNKNYYFYNKQLSKEEYKKEISKINLGDYLDIEKLKKDFERMKLNSIHRFAFITNSYNVSGDNINHAKNCHNCFNLSKKIEDCKNIFWAVDDVKDVYNSGPGVGQLELGYEVFDTGAGGNNCLFSNVVYYSKNIEYSFYCFSCSNCFACFGLRSKNYCIFNRQYNKEEYFSLRQKIIDHMNNNPYTNKSGIVYRYGEFFPNEFSPFCYNETVAQDYFPLEKEETIKSDFLWKDKEIRNYIPTIKAGDLPNDIKEVDDSILDQIIECEHNGNCKDRCSTAFKIIANELIFYRRFNIPLPHLCYGCRHYSRLKQRNPMKLWHRKCMKEGCENEFETSYAPDRPEIIYCEQCYQKEVY
jgi:hypothetical protein